MKTTRSYSMTMRAEAVAATRTRMLDALVELVHEQPIAEVSLEAVASRAGVSVQTVLRHFGSRAALLEAGLAHGRALVVEERRAPVGDVPAAARVVVEHYEARGRWVLSMLSQEHTEAIVRRITTEGRAVHRDWVLTVFEPLLPVSAAARDQAVDLLVVACDVYTWKLLRLDGGLSRRQTIQRIEALVRAVLATSRDDREE